MSMDYMYMGASDSQEATRYSAAMDREDKGEEAAEDAVPEGAIPFLVIVDSRSGAPFALFIDHKGASARVVARVVEVLTWLVYSRIVFKSDQEPIILALKRMVQSVWNKESSLEESPAYDPRANGQVERTVRAIKDQTRTMLSDLESSLQSAVRPDTPCYKVIIQWMTEHAACLMRRCKVHTDGRTSYERLKGRRARGTLTAFGEMVEWKPLHADGQQALDARCEDGCFLGVKDGSGEVIVGTSVGIVKCRDHLRKPGNVHYDESMLRSLPGSPIEPNPGSDDLRLKTRVVEPPIPRERAAEGRPAQVRRMMVRPIHFELAGYTDLRPGCTAHRFKMPWRSHTEACRERIQNVLSSTEAGRAMLARNDRRIAGHSESGRMADQPEAEGAGPEEPPEERRGEAEAAATPVGPPAAATPVEPAVMPPAGEELDELPEGAEYGLDPESEDDVPRDEFGYARMPDAKRARREINDEVMYVGGEDEGRWDINKNTPMVKAGELLRRTKPKLLVGSPISHYVSTMTNQKWAEMDKDAAAGLWKKVTAHAAYVTELYRIQVREGRLFLHEHHDSTRGWALDCLEKVQQLPGVVNVTGDQCMYGLTATVKGDILPAERPTGFATNSADLASELSVRCNGMHSHGLSTDNSASAAAQAMGGDPYPEMLCRAIRRGLRKHLARETVPTSTVDVQGQDGAGEHERWGSSVPDDVSAALEIIAEDRSEAVFQTALEDHAHGEVRCFQLP